MGCCESAPENTIPLSTITNPHHDSSAMMQRILTKIPVHCRQAISDLPTRAFLDAYGHHLQATWHFQRKDFPAAILSETEAIRSLERLLPQQKDHFIFVEMYDILVMILLSIGMLPTAIDGCETVLKILFKHTPTNYLVISEHYFQLSILYKLGKSYQASIGYSTKAIELARLCSEPNQQRIWSSRRQASLNKPIFTVREVKPNPGESDNECRHRAIAEAYAYNANHGTLPHDISEITRIPDKQTESQVTDEILNEVLTNLVTAIVAQCAALERRSGSSWTEGLAIHFKLASMKTSPLSAAIIEAALTMIVDRLNSEDMPNDERYMTLKQASVQVSYTDAGLMFKKGVRVFVYRSRKGQSENE